MDIPALVTSGTATSEGVLGATGTETLVGGRLLDQMYSGARLRFGLWADPCHQHAWEVDGFFIGEATDRYSFSGTGAANSSVLARPFFNVLTSRRQFPNGREDAELVASPNRAQRDGRPWKPAAGFTGSASMGCGRSFQSSGCGPSRRQLRRARRSVPGSAAFAGWRYLGLRRDLQINENLTSLLPSPENGQFLIEDLL